MNTKATPSPKRRQVWRVDLEPVVGSETGKARPAIVVSSDRLGRLPVYVVVPCTDWKPVFANYPWMVRLTPTARNGLTKPCAADGFQVRTISVQRFLTRCGSLTPEEVDDIVASVAVVLEYKAT